METGTESESELLERITNRPTRKREPKGNGDGHAVAEEPRVRAARITIAPANFQTLALQVRGTAPLMIHAFGAKAILKMRERQEAGSTGGKGTKRDKRDFKADYEQARHISEEGWDGIPAGAFRSACIDACRAVGFKMTHAKMSVFAEADGYEKGGGTPLVRIRGSKPTMDIRPARNDDGSMDLRARPLWREWSVVLRVRYDADQFTQEDVANLVERAGQQIGVGEGRAFSRNSHGMGFGMFTVRSDTK